jgi:hypothetical protein
LGLRADYIDGPSHSVPLSLSVCSRSGLSVPAAFPPPLSSSAVEPSISVLPPATSSLSLSSSLDHRPVPSPYVSSSADARFARLEAALAAVTQQLTRERASAPGVRVRSRSPAGRDRSHRGRDSRGGGRGGDGRRDPDRERGGDGRRVLIGGACVAPALAPVSSGPPRSPISPLFIICNISHG